MRYVGAALARIAGVFAGHHADDDLRDELQSHVDMETAENIQRGMPPDEARRQAMLASGGLTRATEAVRDQRGLWGSLRNSKLTACVDSGRFDRIPP